MNLVTVHACFFSFWVLEHFGITRFDSSCMRFCLQPSAGPCWRLSFSGLCLCLCLIWAVGGGVCFASAWFRRACYVSYVFRLISLCSMSHRFSFFVSVSSLFCPFLLRTVAYARLNPDATLADLSAENEHALWILPCIQVHVYALSYMYILHFLCPFFHPSLPTYNTLSIPYRKSLHVNHVFTRCVYFNAISFAHYELVSAEG